MISSPRSDFRPGQFYEYQPGGSGLATIVRINRVLKNSLVHCTMQFVREPTALKMFGPLIETKLHVSRLGKQLDITDFPSHNGR